MAFLFFNCVSGHTILMKRELLAYILPLNENYFHDWWIAYVATNVGKIDFIPQCLVKYRQHDNSETNIFKVKREKNNYKSNTRQRFLKIVKWLEYCKNFKHNKEQSLVEDFYLALLQNRSLKIFLLMVRNWGIIFYIRKKTTIGNLNYIRKLMF